MQDFLYFSQRKDGTWLVYITDKTRPELYYVEVGGMLDLLKAYLSMESMSEKWTIAVVGNPKALINAFPPLSPFAERLVKWPWSAPPERPQCRTRVTTWKKKSKLPVVNHFLSKTERLSPQ